MSALDLPFDTDAILQGLRPWIECESPTWDAAAVSRMMDLAARDLSALGATVETIPGTKGFGSSIRATFPHADLGKPGILVSGHMDTVHPIGTLEKLPFRVEDGLAYGPGIMDMKGGNYIFLEAMRQITRAGLTTPLPVTFLFTPDEEVGTPATRGLIEDAARGQRAVLLP
ncbi:M20/M25/M40 family metallo-hydrolase, partial [Cypionkella sp.]